MITLSSGAGPGALPYMIIPTEPIGSIPRPIDLIAAMMSDENANLDALFEKAIGGTIERLEATGSSVITHREQRTYHNSWSSPFCDDFAATRETAFAKIRARVRGAALTADILQRRR